MVQVDKNVCIACGLCFSTHAEFFVLGSDGKAEAIKQPATPEEESTVQEAIQNCPVGAISVAVAEPTAEAKVIPMNTPDTQVQSPSEPPVDEDMPMAA